MLSVSVRASRTSAFVMEIGTSTVVDTSEDPDQKAVICFQSDL